MFRKWGLRVLLALSSSFCFGDANKTEIGFNLGSPALLNVVVKKELNGLPIQVSGFYWGDAYGVEGGFSFYKSESRYFRSAQIIAGMSRSDEHDMYLVSNNNLRVIDSYNTRDKFKYFGVSTTFQFGTFYLEPGIGYGSDNSSSGLASFFQVGWLFSL
ncbi:hypothetical protein [Teredinibacter purpureus]|uniref:hypothetical protein n=1 Tax=Teredinibacter purpureus TaxID=2731756 RepID=UPI0006973D2F|nr:hypothetical protein [Teredinibacter purpureus]